MAIFFFFLCRIYSIRGIIFSSAFYTKDLVLEFYLQEKFLFYFFLLFLGRLLTVIYRSKIFLSLLSSFTIKNFFRLKIGHFIFLFFFRVITIFFSKVIQEISFTNIYCYISSVEIFLINLIIFLFFFFKVKKYRYLNIEILFIKNLFFTFFRKIKFFSPLRFFIIDRFFFKPVNFNLNYLVLSNFFLNKF